MDNRSQGHDEWLANIDLAEKTEKKSHKQWRTDVSWNGDENKNCDQKKQK